MQQKDPHHAQSREKRRQTDISWVMTQPVTVRYQGLQRTQRDHRFDMERNHKDSLAYEVIYNYTYISKNIGFAFQLLLSFQKHQY